MLGGEHWDGCRWPGWRVGIGALGNMVRMGLGLEQGGSVAVRRVSELGVFGGIWVMMGGDGTSFCHKRHVMHKKLGVLAPAGMTVLPELGGRGRWQWQVAQSVYPTLPSRLPYELAHLQRYRNMQVGMRELDDTVWHAPSLICLHHGTPHTSRCSASLDPISWSPPQWNHAESGEN